METTPIQNKDEVAAQLTAAAMHLIAANKTFDSSLFTEKAAADRALKLFCYIRTGLEDEKQLSQLSQDL